jgi:hypothetical protein
MNSIIYNPFRITLIPDTKIPYEPYGMSIAIQVGLPCSYLTA